MADDTEESLWDTLAGVFGFGGDGSPRQREMVMSPAPAKPTFTRRPDEDATMFSLRRSGKIREWEAIMRQRELDPDSFMVPAAQAEGTEGASRYNRDQAIDQALEDAGV